MQSLLDKFNKITFPDIWEGDQSDSGLSLCEAFSLPPRAIILNNQQNAVRLRLSRFLSVKVAFDELYDKFLSERKLGEGRKRHYEVLRRMIHRYESYVKCSQGRVRYSFDVVKVDKGVLDNLYDYIENEYEYVETYPRILEDNPEARDIKPRGENYMSGVFKEVRAFFNWAYKNKIIDLFPFEGFEMP